MHMADALISPAVGGTMWAATAGLTYYSARKLKQEMDDRKLPLMGVLGAFVFAAQMINFTIPATGSSGHLVGGIILSILLGPYAAFLTLASVITVQALFFADGGLLALGCNIFNMGFFACFIAYPFIYKKIAGDRTTRGRILQGALAAAILSVVLGALRGRAGDALFRHLGTAFLHVYPLDAADPPGHRRRGRPHHCGGGDLRLEGPAGNPGDGAPRRGVGGGPLLQAGHHRTGGGGRVYRRTPLLVRLHPPGRPGVVHPGGHRQGGGSGAQGRNPRGPGRAPGETRLPAGL